MKFIETNPNPKKLIIEDCMVRAVTIAVERHYNFIYAAFLFHDWTLTQGHNKDRIVIDLVLDFLKINATYTPILHTDSCPSNIDSWSTDPTDKYYCNGTFIYMIDGHAACVIDGVLFDTWDCQEEKVYGIYKLYFDQPTKFWYQ